LYQPVDLLGFKLTLVTLTIYTSGSSSTLSFSRVTAHHSMIKGSAMKEQLWFPQGKQLA